MTRSDNTTPTTLNSEIEPSTGSLLNDRQVNALALAFMRAEKPPQLTPSDVLLVTYLIHRRAFDHPVTDSQLTFSEVMGCSLDTVARSLARLDRLGWITKAKRKGHSDGTALVHTKLPAAVRGKLQITDSANELVRLYMAGLDRRCHPKRGNKNPRKGWLDQQYVSAQKILDLCKGDLRAAAAIIAYALDTPAYAVAGRSSLYKVREQFKKIKAAKQVSDKQASEQAERAAWAAERAELTEQLAAAQAVAGAREVTA